MAPHAGSGCGRAAHQAWVPPGGCASRRGLRGAIVAHEALADDTEHLRAQGVGVEPEVIEHHGAVREERAQSARSRARSAVASAMICSCFRCRIDEGRALATRSATSHERPECNPLRLLHPGGRGDVDLGAQIACEVLRLCDAAGNAGQAVRIGGRLASGKAPGKRLQDLGGGRHPPRAVL